MNALIDDVTGATGMRAGCVHVIPSADVESTMSFCVQPGRKRQSCHTAYIVPFESTSTDGSEIARMTPLSRERRSETADRVNVAPPSVERTAIIVPLSA